MRLDHLLSKEQLAIRYPEAVAGSSGYGDRDPGAPRSIALTTRLALTHELAQQVRPFGEVERGGREG